MRSNFRQAECWQLADKCLERIPLLNPQRKSCCKWRTRKWDFYLIERTLLLRIHSCPDRMPSWQQLRRPWERTTRRGQGLIVRASRFLSSFANALPKSIHIQESKTAGWHLHKRFGHYCQQYMLHIQGYVDMEIGRVGEFGNNIMCLALSLDSEELILHTRFACADTGMNCYNGALGTICYSAFCPDYRIMFSCIYAMHWTLNHPCRFVGRPAVHLLITRATLKSICLQYTSFFGAT